MENQIKHNIETHNKNAKDYNKDHYEIYNSYEQNRIDKTIERLLGFFKDDKIRVLDFGAGTGNLTLKFLKHNCWVTACDISSKSLEIIKEKNNYKKLKLVTFDGKKLPFPDNFFDIVAVYSVLHHIPDYLFSIKEMIRVTKKSGFIYIDHEANKNRWNPNNYLLEYYKKTKQTKIEHLIKLIKTRKLFTLDFIKTFFIKIFINRKYRREGDIHVWKEDHLNWDEIKDLIKKENSKIIKEKDYLMYKPQGKIDSYNKYKDKCNDTKYLLIKK